MYLIYYDPILFTNNQKKLNLLWKQTRKIGSSGFRLYSPSSQPSHLRLASQAVQ